MGDESATPVPAGLFRRLAALFYDLVLVTALAFAATFALLPLTHGEAILTSTQGLVGHAYRLAVALLVFGYFGWSWTRAGETLGMKAWRLRLESADARRLDWGQSLTRFLLGTGLVWLTALGTWYLSRTGNALERGAAAALLLPAVANYAWVLVDPQGRTLQDLAGRARVVCRG